MLDQITVPCSILTNSWEKHARNVTDYLEISSYFTKYFDIIFNLYKGKPNTSAFTGVLEYLHLKAEEVLFIDDIGRFTDVFASLGGNVILIDEDEMYTGKPYKTVRYIREIAPILKEYGVMK